jgi:hypothetical protein
MLVGTVSMLLFSTGSITVCTFFILGMIKFGEKLLKYQETLRYDVVFFLNNPAGIRIILFGSEYVFLT